MTVHKKNETHTTSSGQTKSKEVSKEKTIESKPSETKTGPIIVSDTITETIEVIGGSAPQPSVAKNPDSSASEDPLNDFKEKMVKEESLASDSSQKKNYMWPILFIFIAAIVLLVVIFAYRQGFFQKAETKEISSVPTPTITVEPTKTVDLGQYEIEVLNGSEIDGEASRQKTSLEEKGFTVSLVGNADSSDYTDTVIQVKEEVGKDFIAKLKETLEDTFTVGETESLSDSSSSPVIVILGTKK